MEKMVNIRNKVASPGIESHSMMKNPCGARRKRFGALDSCFGLVIPHQQSIPFPYLQAPRVIKLSSSAALVVLN